MDFLDIHVFGLSHRDWMAWATFCAVCLLGYFTIIVFYAGMAARRALVATSFLGLPIILVGFVVIEKYKYNNTDFWNVE